MIDQKHLFELPEDIHYLNGAYMSPNLISVRAAGTAAVQRKSNPLTIQESDFFEPAEELKSLFGKLINGSAAQIAVIPSASYGLMSAISNVSCGKGQHALVVSEEFPSAHLTLQRWCNENNAELKVLFPSKERQGRTEKWNDQIIEAINKDTALLVMSSVHWMDGTLFNLEAIGAKCRETDTIFIVDGTQSVGALPMDVAQFNIDALICAGYKWLMGPYSSGLAYYSERFNIGKPIEESWMNRNDASDFSTLTKYPEEYSPGAGRYNVGEFSNFITLPMLKAAIEQILEWKPENIQQYCKQLMQPLFTCLEVNGIPAEKPENIASHLVGIYLPEQIDIERLITDLKLHKIYVSARGRSIRVSPHVYNTNYDVEAFLAIFQKHLP
ncbi:aminotransferase [Marivirga lumbricoides]|uniref:Aminotransferase n=1 Tax=Marivirga lumbricoides TaxID=1046115 RepID=A0ABQ1MA45_9BACT|nr:aminotransferase [Marivirga lumbricoides]